MKVTEAIEFNKTKIQPYMRTISEEEEQWLITPLHARTALDTAASSAIELTHNTPMSSAMELQEIAQKSLEQYQIQQLLLPEPSQSSRTPQSIELVLQYHSKIPNTSQAPLDILDPCNADMDMCNVIEHPCNRKPSAKAQGYAAALIHAYSDKIPQFHTAFLAGISQSNHHDQLLPPLAS